MPDTSPDGLRHRIAALPATEVASRLAAGDAVLLPLGSTETHGPAAPMGDFLLAEAIAGRIADAAGDALVAPALPFGGADFFAAIPGALSLGPAALSAVLDDLLGALHAQGVGRILLVNGHGGSATAIEAATRALRARTGQVVPTLHLWRLAADLLPGLGADPRATGHGGDPVLSVALHLLPNLCRPALLAPRGPGATLLGLPVSGFGTVSLDGAAVAVPVTIGEIAPDGVVAEDPRGCDAALGARIVERLVGTGTALLARMRE